MSRIHLCAATILLSLAAGCGTTSAPPAEAPTTPAITAETIATETTETTAEETTTETATPAAAPKTATRRVGDYVVYRFSGSFRNVPATLTQKIVAREPGVLVVDFTLDEGKKKQTFRVRTDDSSTEKAVISVARMDKDIETPATVAAFEAMIAKTVLSADRNEDFLGAEAVSVDVAGKPIACTKSSFQVRVGKKTAFLHVVASEDFAWGDIGGDITTKDGKVLYRAEILDAGNTKPTNTVATTDE